MEGVEEGQSQEGESKGLVEMQSDECQPLQQKVNDQTVVKEQGETGGDDIRGRNEGVGHLFAQCGKNSEAMEFETVEKDEGSTKGLMGVQHEGEGAVYIHSDERQPLEEEMNDQIMA